MQNLWPVGEWQIERQNKMAEIELKVHNIVLWYPIENLLIRFQLSVKMIYTNWADIRY